MVSVWPVETLAAGLIWLFAASTSKPFATVTVPARLAPPASVSVPPESTVVVRETLNALPVTLSASVRTSWRILMAGVVESTVTVMGKARVRVTVMVSLKMERRVRQRLEFL